MSPEARKTGEGAKGISDRRVRSEFTLSRVSDVQLTDRVAADITEGIKRPPRNVTACAAIFSGHQRRGINALEPSGLCGLLGGFDGAAAIGRDVDCVGHYLLLRL